MTKCLKLHQKKYWCAVKQFTVAVKIQGSIQFSCYISPTYYYCLPTSLNKLPHFIWDAYILTLVLDINNLSDNE